MGAAGLWLSPVRPSLGQQRQEIRLTGTSEQYRLALERQYTCPNPRLALPTSLLDPRHLSAPVPLPSTSPDFSLTLTYDTTVCNAFSLTISRTDKAHCAAVEASIEPSADPALSTWIKERLGPDSFIVQVDGAERRMDHTPTRYVGACEYAFEFRLANAGPVWVNATHANQVRCSSLAQATKLGGSGADGPRARTELRGVPRGQPRRRHAPPPRAPHDAARRRSPPARRLLPVLPYALRTAARRLFPRLVPARAFNLHVLRAPTVRPARPRRDAHRVVHPNPAHRPAVPAVRRPTHVPPRDALAHLDGVRRLCPVAVRVDARRGALRGPCAVHEEGREGAVPWGQSREGGVRCGESQARGRGSGREFERQDGDAECDDREPVHGAWALLCSPCPGDRH